MIREIISLPPNVPFQPPAHGSAMPTVFLQLRCTRCGVELTVGCRSFESASQMHLFTLECPRCEGWIENQALPGEVIESIRLSSESAEP